MDPLALYTVSHHMTRPDHKYVWDTQTHGSSGQDSFPSPQEPSQACLALNGPYFPGFGTNQTTVEYVDTTPDSFNYTDLASYPNFVDLGVYAYSNAVTITGITDITSFTVSGGTFITV